MGITAIRIVEVFPEPALVPVSGSMFPLLVLSLKNAGRELKALKTFYESNINYVKY